MTHNGGIHLARELSESNRDDECRGKKQQLRNFSQDEVAFLSEERGKAIGKWWGIRE